MELKGIKIGFALTGSFCTFKKVIPKMKELINQGAEIIPIMSFNSYNLDTKFGKAKDFIKDSKIPYQTIIDNSHPYAPLSVASRLIYLDGLILAKNYDEATNLFQPYMESRNDTMLALGYYANAKICAKRIKTRYGNDG